MPPTSTTKSKSSPLPGSDFIIPPEPSECTLCLAFGATGNGKTTFAMNAPGPIAYIDIDLRGRHAVKRARELGKDVMYLPLDRVRKAGGKTDAQIIAEARKVWDNYMKNYELALNAADKDQILTIVIDTASELHKSIQFLSIFGRTDKVMQRDYGIPRAEYRDMLKKAREHNVNLVQLCHQTEKYVNNAPTGKMTWAGFEDMGADMDFAVHLRMRNKKKSEITDEDSFPVRFECEVVKAGINAEEFGQVYTDEDWGGVDMTAEGYLGPFVYSAMRQFPGTSPEDWGVQL